MPLHRDDRDWERLARRQPYWAVLTEPRYRGRALDAAGEEAFFASGERHVADLFAAAEAVFGQPLRPRRALDFGCGVGRLLPALARRCGHVVGADIAPAMVDLARRQCRRCGLDNCEAVVCADGLGGIGGDFDFIHSVLVFQHIEPTRGMDYLAQLCDRLRPGGFAVLHVTIAADSRAGDRRLAAIGAALPPLRAAGNLLRGRPPFEPPVRMYVYAVEDLRRVVESRGCTLVHASPANDDAYAGKLLWLRRTP